jgi:hypothetical protein
LLQDYLAQGNYLMEHRLVGSTIEVDVPSDAYTPRVTLLAPGGSKDSRLVNQTRLSVESTGPDRLTTTIGKWLPSELMRETDAAGVYDVWFRRTDSSQEVKRYTLNVDTLESEMALANRQKRSSFVRLALRGAHCALPKSSRYSCHRYGGCSCLRGHPSKS